MSDDEQVDSPTDAPHGPEASGPAEADEDRLSGAPSIEQSHLFGVPRNQTPYTESQVIMTTVKIVAPFVFTYGLFITFHGSGSPGGGFQGGAVMASVVLMIAFAFGIDATREWVGNSVLTGLGVGGVVVFAGIGLLTMALGGTFLEYHVLPIDDPVMWGMEAVEIGGIALIVGGILVGLFFLLAAGESPADRKSRNDDTLTDGGTVRDSHRQTARRINEPEDVEGEHR